MSFYVAAWRPAPYASTTRYKAFGEEGNAADWPANWQGYPGDPSAAPPDVTPGGTPSSSSSSDYQNLPIGPPDYGSSGGGGGGSPSYPSSGSSSSSAQASLAGGGALLLGVALVAAIGYALVAK